LKKNWVNFFFQLLLKHRKNREIDGTKKSKVEKREVKHKIASLNIELGRSKHPEKSTEM